MKQTKSVRSATDNRDGQGQQWPQVVYTTRPLFERNLPKKKKREYEGGCVLSQFDISDKVKFFSQLCQRTREIKPFLLLL